MDETGLLVSLLEAYSPSGDEARAVRVFLRMADALGLATAEDEAGNGIARAGSGGPHIMFLGHIDTVEGELPVRVRDGRVYGRGACDAKGALAAALMAAARHEGSGQITVVAAVGEEEDSRGARALLPGPRPDFLIIGEPSGWSHVTIGYKGNLSLVLTFEGQRHHLSSPAETTVETALEAVGRVRDFCARHEGGTPFRSLTAKVPSIQTARRGGKEVVEVAVNLRLPPGFPSQSILDFLDEAAFAYRVLDRSEAVEVDPRNGVVRSLVQGIRAEQGRPALVRKTGTSDLNIVLPAWRCPAAAYGPGDAHLDHTDEESVRIEDLQRAARVLRSAFRSLHAPTRPIAVTKADG